MRKVAIIPTRLLKVNTSKCGISIEEQLQRVMAGESIDLKGRTTVYTERKDGVLYETNIRSDRFEKSMEAFDYIARTHIAKRNEEIEKNNVKGDRQKGESANSTNSTQGTENQ